jgi:hypothetical protein
MEYRTRLPGGVVQVVKFNKNSKKTVEYLSPKKKKKKSS